MLNEDEDEKCIDEIRVLRERLTKSPMAILEFDFDLFDSIIDKVIVEDDSKVYFVLYSGLKLQEVIAWN